MADIQFNLRIPEELKEKIKEAALENGRSINAEAQMRLEQSFTDIPSDQVATRYEKIVEDLLVHLMGNLESKGVHADTLRGALKVTRTQVFPDFKPNDDNSVNNK
ncbi:Arc family DNA-binding protein [Acinetobacter sp. Tr-809]|uniref:Arc family DNA-binding protein n=1 Tax=Acinetobacter sp. Tr-809 TaxID=2608324 RepID=UPI00141D9DCC|nr:Arc family DNA-binding protein [Acinetobacter sp. Tr-809]NIE95189.1 Arc family DNA-binding protein [Acinetobacter sp. Tr-809]